MAFHPVTTAMRRLGPIPIDVYIAPAAPNIITIHPNMAGRWQDRPYPDNRHCRAYFNYKLGFCQYAGEKG